MPKITDIADQIMQELEDTSDLSLASVAFWCRNNIGKLNSFIHTSYRVDPVSYEYTPAMDEEELSVLKQMFKIHYYGIKIRENLGAAGTNAVIEITADGASVRKINKTTIAKDWMQLKREEEANLKDQIAAYNIDKAKPRQVHGNDNVSATTNTTTTELENLRNRV